MSKSKEVRKISEADVYNLMRDRFSVIKSQIMSSAVSDFKDKLSQDDLRKLQKNMNSVFSNHEEHFCKSIFDLL